MFWRLGDYLEHLCCPYCQGKLRYRAPYLYCAFHLRRFLVSEYSVDFRLEHAERVDREDCQ
jgi:hypothetical protein